MAHRKMVYRYGPGGDKYTEYEFKFVGRFGAKGEKRGPRKKATPEQIQKQNQWNKEKTVLRLIRENFDQGDLWITCKFPAGTRMSGKDLKAIRKAFLTELRRAYKKRDAALRYICRLEIGERGGPHMHMVVNRVPGGGTSALIQTVWRKYGKNVHFTPLYEDGDYKNLAEYITKPLKEEEISGQLTLFGEEEDRKIFSAYSCSKGLRQPQPEEHVYHRRTVRELVKNGPEPSPGYYIDRDSIRYGVNPYTGMTYFYYTEIRLEYGGICGKRAGDSG